MAVDTRSKRFSLLSLNVPFAPNIPEPSGSFDQGDRQQLLHGYSGILWTDVLPVDFDTITLNGLITRNLDLNGSIQRELSLSGKITRDLAVNGLITRGLTVNGNIQRELEINGELE